MEELPSDFDAALRARLEEARPQIAFMATLFRLTDVAARPVPLPDLPPRSANPPTRPRP